MQQIASDLTFQYMKSRWHVYSIRSKHIHISTYPADIVAISSGYRSRGGGL